MRLNTRTVVLFSTLIVLLIGLLGCFPQQQPDTTPPEIHSVVVSNITPTPVVKGQPVSATVTVSATDRRSNLKHAEIVLYVKLDAVGAVFTEVAREIVAFPAQRSATTQHTFAIPTTGTAFPAAGNYEFRAKAYAEDTKGNKTSEAQSMTSSSVGFVVSPSLDPNPPVIEQLQADIGNWVGGLLRVPDDRPIQFSVRATDADGDLRSLKLEIQTSATEKQETTVTHGGASQLTAVIPNLTYQIDGAFATFFATATAIDDVYEPQIEVFLIRVVKQAVEIVQENHLGELAPPPPNGLPQVHWGRYQGTVADREEVIADPEGLYEQDPTYTLPFAITELLFDFGSLPEIVTGRQATLFIYSDPTELFSEALQYQRGSGVIGQDDTTWIRFANLSADDAKWLAIKIEGTPLITKPWFVWKIAAADHATEPQIDLEYRGTLAEFIEGKPIKVTVKMKDEILRSLDDLRIRFQNEVGQFLTLEQLIAQTNASLPSTAHTGESPEWQSDWRFAVRYHVRVSFDEFLEGDLDNFRRLNMDVDPDPKIVYAISQPHMGQDPDPTDFDNRAIHRWYRYDGTLADRVTPATGIMPRLWDTLDPVDFIYYFGIPDRHIEQLNQHLLITEMATLQVEIYAEIVVVSVDSPEDVLFVADGALGAANRAILEVPGYKQYDLSFSGRNARGFDNYNDSNARVFPIYADNTSPTITVTYGPVDQQLIFADRRPHRLSTGAFDRIGVPMFFADTIRVKGGQEVTFKAEDDVALYDFLVVHTNLEPEQDHLDWRSPALLPPILNPNNPVDIPMGFDFIYRRICPSNLVAQKFYQGVAPNGDPHAETLPAKTLNEIFADEPANIIAKALFTNVYNNTFSIDNRYEFYDNYTWSNVRNAATDPVNATLQNRYFGMEITQQAHSVVMPSIPGTYWVWVVARDRGAQDTFLFDYEDSRVNVDPKEVPTTRVYPQDVQHHQSLIFANANNLENPNNFYENSESEADAPMVVLLRVIVETHSMDIQRLDIHEPDLVSYPATWTYNDNVRRVWFAHSYNVLQLDKQTKVAEFDPNEPKDLLPVDMYPVFKRTSDKDAGNRFGVQAGTLDTPQVYNLWRAMETVDYSSNPLQQDTEITMEAVPVVGGPNPTTFRVKTHEDIEQVILEFVQGEVWTVEEYAFNKPLIYKTITIDKDFGSSKHDGRGMGGYWEWTLDWHNDPQLASLVGIEATQTLVVKARHVKEGTFWEQWQWPVFVDTLGPRIELYSIDDENSSRTYSHLNILERVPRSLSDLEPSVARRWGAFHVYDRGGLMFEYAKGISAFVRDHVPPVYADYPPVYDYPFDVAPRLRMDRARDLVKHQVRLWWPSATYVNFNHTPDPMHITNVLNSYLLGFPSDSIAVASLRYLTRAPIPPEDLAITTPWHQYFIDGTGWGAYGTLTRDPRSIPEHVLFNNIDFYTVIWETTSPNSAKYIQFSLVDELNNPGHWDSWLKLKIFGDFEVLIDVIWTDIPEASPPEGPDGLPDQPEEPTAPLKEATMTVHATATNGRISKIEVSICPCGDATETFEFDPSLEVVSVVVPVPPSYEPTRTVHVKAYPDLDWLMSMARDQEPAGQPVEETFEIGGIYSGNAPVIDIDFFGMNMKRIPEDIPTLFLPSMALNPLAQYTTTASPVYIRGYATAEDDNCDRFDLWFEFGGKDEWQSDFTGNALHPTRLATTVSVTAPATDTEYTFNANAWAFDGWHWTEETKSATVVYIHPKIISAISTDTSIMPQWTVVVVDLSETIVAQTLDYEVWMLGQPFQANTVRVSDNGSDWVQLNGSDVRTINYIRFGFNQILANPIENVVLFDVWTKSGGFIPTTNPTDEDDLLGSLHFLATDVLTQIGYGVFTGAMFDFGSMQADISLEDGILLQDIIASFNHEAILPYVYPIKYGTITANNYAGLGLLTGPVPPVSTLTVGIPEVDIFLLVY